LKQGALISRGHLPAALDQLHGHPGRLLSGAASLTLVRHRFDVFDGAAPVARSFPRAECVAKAEPCRGAHRAERERGIQVVHFCQMHRRMHIQRRASLDQPRTLVVLSTKRLVAVAKFLVAATKNLFVVPNFVAVTKLIFSVNLKSERPPSILK